METLAGRADFEVTAIGGVAPETLTRLAELPYDLRIRPRIEDYAVLADSDRTAPLLGIDLVAGSNAPGASGPVSEPAGDAFADPPTDIAAVWTGYCLLGPLHKERRFRRYFRDQFTAYQRRVPYWLPRRPSVSTKPP